MYEEFGRGGQRARMVEEAQKKGRLVGIQKGREAGEIRKDFLQR